MAVRAIVISGDPVLHSPAAPVVDFDDNLRDLVRDMFETMDAAPGVGLAATQVGIGLRIFTYSYQDDDDVALDSAALAVPACAVGTVTVMFTPQISTPVLLCRRRAEPPDDGHDVAELSGSLALMYTTRPVPHSV